jgi:hypothetical protein
MITKSENSHVTEQPANPQKPVNDAGTIAVNAHFKIFDPNTDEVFVEERG